MLNIQAKLKNSFLLSQEETELPRSVSEQVVTLESMKKSGNIKLEKSKSIDSSALAQARAKLMLQSNIEKYSHLLIGKVRDTQMIFSFFIEASIIDVDQTLTAGLVTQ